MPYPKTARNGPLLDTALFIFGRVICCCPFGLPASFRFSLRIDPAVRRAEAVGKERLPLPKADVYISKPVDKPSLCAYALRWHLHGRQ
jgi:hypothetical protein